MRSTRKLLILLGLQLLTATVYAQMTQVKSVHYWTTSKQTRLMLDVSSAPVHRVTLLEQPARLVIDIRDAELEQALTQPPADHPLFSAVSAMPNKQGLRIIANLKKLSSYQSFALKPNKMHGHRLIVDFSPNGAINSANRKNTKESVTTQRPKPVETAVKRSKDIIVAIDAGHGGEDPGAHGPNGTEEKKVVYSIAQRLEALINDQKGMKAVMVRKGDYYVGLRKRMEIAREAGADLFISIHADAYGDTHVKGASVFTLSRRGASSEAARWLADRENAADLIGGVRLDDKEDVLASVLLDLSQTATQEASKQVAGQVLKNFENIGELHFGAVQKAGFLVLKSPDIPSILVETAFISNPSEERKLNSAAHQYKIALAIFKGVRNYFKQYSPVDTRVAVLETDRQSD
ncbi:MAG: N-acetylmuramoyl-L-alanine amidase [Gammaproteobacteria bacterium]